MFKAFKNLKVFFCGDGLLAEIGSLPKYTKHMLLAFEFLLQGSVLSLLVSLGPN